MLFLGLFIWSLFSNLQPPTPRLTTNNLQPTIIIPTTIPPTTYLAAEALAKSANQQPTTIPPTTYLAAEALAKSANQQPTTVPPTPISGPPGTGLSRSTVRTTVGDFTATILSLDMTATKMKTDTADDHDCQNGCSVNSLSNFVTKNAGFAGVNGTYFCPAAYPDCAGKTNSFDFPVYNSRLNKWIQADKLGWNERRAIVYTDGSGVHYLNNSAGFGGGLSAGIINYPGLLDNGNVQIDSVQSGLSDKQKIKNTKVGLGVVSPSRLLIVVANNVTMYEFAHVFKTLGATGALNLDTGGSAALFYNGSYQLGPGRDIPNAVVFTR